jgi:hypothetical protein
MQGVAHALTKRNVGFVSQDPFVGSGSGTEGRNFLLLA